MDAVGPTASLIDGRRVKETRVHMKLPSEGKAKGQFFLVTSEMFSFSKNYFLIMFVLLCCKYRVV